MLMKK
jgi:hypothetical protein